MFLTRAHSSVLSLVVTKQITFWLAYNHQTHTTKCIFHTPARAPASFHDDRLGPENSVAVVLLVKLRSPSTMNKPALRLCKRRMEHQADVNMSRRQSRSWGARVLGGCPSNTKQTAFMPNTGAAHDGGVEDHVLWTDWVLILQLPVATQTHAQ